MSQRIYRIAPGYWPLSILVIVAFVAILGVTIGGIPGFPHFEAVIARWQRTFAVRPYEALVLAVLWVGVVGFFSYITLKTIRIMVWPTLVRGILQRVDKASASADRMFWIEVSGSRHRIRNDRDLSSRLDTVDVLGKPVDIRIGVGDRVLSVDVVQEQGHRGA